MWNRAMFGDSELHARDGYMAGTGFEPDLCPFPIASKPVPAMYPSHACSSLSPNSTIPHARYSFLLARNNSFVFKMRRFFPIFAFEKCHDL